MQGQRIVNLGMIGLGPRGETLLATYFCLLETGEALRFKAICNGDATSLESFVEPHMKAFHGQLVAIFEGEGDEVTISR